VLGDACPALRSEIEDRAVVVSVRAGDAFAEFAATESGVRICYVMLGKEYEAEVTAPEADHIALMDDLLHLIRVRSRPSALIGAMN
jgi:hypothetical protein